MTPIGPISLSPFQTGSVQLLAEVDTVALEPMEFFTLTMTLTGHQLPANAFASRSTFLHFELDVWILDASGKCLSILIMYSLSILASINCWASM